MSSTDSDAFIRDYIMANGSTYTREALREALVGAGHDPAAVDAALDEWRARRHGSAGDRRTFGRWAAGVHIAALVAMVVFVLIVKGTTGTGYLGIAAVILGVSLLISWAGTAAIGRALLPNTGVVVALILPVLGALILGGTCIGLMNAVIPTPPRMGTGELLLEEPAFYGTSTAACRATVDGVDISFAEFDTGDQPLVNDTVDGHLVNAYLSTYGGLYLSIAFTPADPKSTDGYWNYVSNPTTNFSTEIAADDLSGTVVFAGLPLESGDPGASAPEPPQAELSGTINWDCR